MVEYQITQLADNAFFDPDLPISSPQIAGTKAVWSSSDGNDREIFFYNGNTTLQLTSNDLFDGFPQISGNNLVWYRSLTNPLLDPLSGGEIIFYDGNTITQIGSSNTSTFPVISGNNVVWGDNLIGGEVLFYDGNTTTQLTDSGLFIGASPNTISENKVAWTDVESGELFFYDGNNVIQLTDNNLANVLPFVSGNNVVWIAGNPSDTNDSDVFFYDGNTTIQLTNNDLFNVASGISGNNIVWVGNDGNDFEIFFYDGNIITQLTDNETDDFAARISGDNIVWQASDGNDLEIFFYDGNIITQLTDNEINDENPAISGNNIVWEANGDIFLATPLTIELYRFRNNTFDTGTYLFVGEAERDAILANPDLNQNFELEGVQEDGSVNPAFTASLQSDDNLIPFYRLRNLDVPGTYLFVSTDEYNAIFADNSNQQDKWVKEGLDGGGNDIPEFYLYGGGTNLGAEFHRFQNTQNNTFLYAGPEETGAINENPNLSALYKDQGIAFESFL